MRAVVEKGSSGRAVVAGFLGNGYEVTATNQVKPAGDFGHNLYAD